MTVPSPVPLGAPDVSVLVPVLDEADHIRDVVVAMRSQREAGEVELLFADGGSSDATREILDELAGQDPRIRVFDNPRRSTASGLNVCLRHARGTYLARMDAHAFYPDRYLAAGIGRLARGDTSWVSGPAIPAGRGPVGRAVALALTGPLGRGGSRKWSPGAAEYELDSGVFAGVWRRETVLAYGGWDEDWPSNQDSEMAGRFLRHSERLVCLPEMAAHYLPRESLGALARQYRGYGFYRARTARRHPDTLRRSALLPPIVVLTWAAAVLAPGFVRRLARLGVAGHATAVAAAGLKSAADGARSDAILVPSVLATMHAAHGVGYLHGFLRFGPPWRVLRRIVGLSGAAAATGADDGWRVFAPSLEREG
jgi:glycosyltransferase involved in cell wall biosynthesis